MNSEVSHHSDEEMSFDRFCSGDVAVIEREFHASDFELFSMLSGDKNPLHHDSDYAAQSRFGKTIVPLHLTLAPLSQIAGMIFPGEPSLYLGHEVRAVKPVFYGDLLRYSARIETVNQSHRMLTLRVLAIRDIDVVVDAVLQVQALKQTWRAPAENPVIPAARKGSALVTGTSGYIGRAIALALGTAGWPLLLHDRQADARRDELAIQLERLGVPHEFVAADLTTEEGQVTLAESVSQLGDMEVLVHAASPGVESPLDSLVAANFSALRHLVNSALPSMLARQRGKILFISTAMIRGVAGWDDYVGAKTMATGYVAGIDKRYASYNVRGLSLLPGVVATPFSSPYSGDETALLPQEVAEIALDMIEQPTPTSLMVEVGRRQEGDYGFHFASSRGQLTAVAPTAGSVPSEVPQTSDANQAGDVKSVQASLAELIRRKLRLSADFSLAGGGLGVTPGWDSLRQIELLLEIESTLGVAFSSTEIEALTQFDQLEQAIVAKRTML